MSPVPVSESVVYWEHKGGKMTKFDVAYYKAKYRFQWWWYDGEGNKTVEAAAGAVLLPVFIYTMWFLAWYFEP